MIDLEIRKQIISYCIKMHTNGLIQGTGGNVSVRSYNGFFLTPSGMDYLSTEPSDIVKMDFSGNVIEGTRTPSIEMEMHRLILQKRPETNAIVHTHSVYATAIASTRQSMPAITDNQVVLFGGNIPIAEYGGIGTKELAENVVNGLGNGNAVLLSNHGVVVVAETLKKAVFYAEMVELFAKIYLLSASIGGGVTLSEDEIVREYKDVTKRYGQK